MAILSGVFTLLLVLFGMSIFAFKFPKGKEALKALSGAACATYLPEAFLRYAVGGVFGLPVFSHLGEVLGGFGGLTVGALVPMFLGISPVTAIIIGLSLSSFKLLPAFVAAYIISFLVKEMEKRIPEGLDLLVIILIIPFLVFTLAGLFQPFMLGILSTIGGAITEAMTFNPYIMGAILGVVISSVGMTPLSSMVLTSLIGITGVPMAIGALACYGTSVTLLILMKSLKFSNSTALSAFVEPLTQTDIISMNALPIFTTNAISAAINGIIVAIFSLEVPVTGMATPWAGLLVTLGNNPLGPTLLAVLLITIISSIVAFLGSKFFASRIIIQDNNKDL